MQSNIVELYWSELVELKTQICYHGLLRNRDNRLDMWTKVLPALTSCVGLLAWLVRQEDGIYWGVLVAVSYVVTAVKHLFPFEVRRNKTFEVTYEFNKQFLIMEKNWGKIADGDFTQDEIASILFKVKNKLNDIEHEYLSDVIIPQITTIRERAEKDAIQYFVVRYHVTTSQGDCHVTDDGSG